MNVAMRLTSNLDLTDLDDIVENIPTTGTLTIKGNLSDLTRLMEAIKMDHLHPHVETVVVHEAPRHMKFCALATQGQHTRYTYPDGGLNKIECIKAIRPILGTGLKETKDFVEGSLLYVPEILIDNLRKEGIILIPA